MKKIKKKSINNNVKIIVYIKFGLYLMKEKILKGVLPWLRLSEKSKSLCLLKNRKACLIGESVNSMCK